MTPAKLRRLKRSRDNQALAEAAGNGSKSLKNASGKKIKLKSRKWYVRELDAELSRQVRDAQPNCEFCPKPSEHLFHYLTRKNFSTRWLRENVTASCAADNLRYEHESDFVHHVIELYKQQRGFEAWDKLVRLHHTPTKFSRTDLAEMLNDLRKGSLFLPDAVTNTKQTS